MLSPDTIRQFVRAHPGKVSLVVIAAVLYIAFNIWVFYFTKSGGLKTNPVTTITEKIKSFGGLQSPKSSPPERPTPTPPAKPDLAPPDTPKTGPGPHGCGIRTGCVTFTILRFSRKTVSSPSPTPIAWGLAPTAPNGVKNKKAMMFKFIV